MTTNKRLVPGTPEHTKAWTDNPALIARQLTHAERLDPKLNPLHPFAESRSQGVRLEPELMAAGRDAWRDLENQHTQHMTGRGLPEVSFRP